ncbi:MAG TPA: hypothetical protein VK324_13270 [Tepidisphaeraceae bacterium]|nr:hypothetical protein [Tepidisphaeraceae bacterium]
MRDAPGGNKIADLDLCGPCQLVYAPGGLRGADGAKLGAMMLDGGIAVIGELSPPDACEATARMVGLYLLDRAVRDAERKAAGQREAGAMQFNRGGEPTLSIDGRDVPVRMAFKPLRSPDGRQVKATVTDDAITVSLNLSPQKMAAAAATAALRRVFEGPSNGRTLYVE